MQKEVVPLIESLKLLNISVATYAVINSFSAFEKHVNKLSFPIVLKISSPKIIHKTEQKAVYVAYTKEEALKTAKEFLKKGQLVVQEYVSGVEFFLGIKKDASFGHVLLAGIGGIFVEVYKDISTRVCPITKKDAEEMLDELKGKKLLDGFRGKTVNKKLLVDSMVQLSKLPNKHPEIEELDVNPFMLGKTNKAVDARIVVNK
ncbi:hypothetical protein COV18_05250 [Candidatus Woesearchaeota archaeon CG10_big_fil_rev_8_21_14_0_10_37_12]|nr:MAG: hypothetical protein COV18_05250 [Candidatus Woesearchaeota archaeon CG10_big_fil_rev_8_21_14_0_10_37_12]